MADAEQSLEVGTDEIRRIEELGVGEPPEEDHFIAEGDCSDEYLQAPIKCPNPTRWRQTRVAVRAVGRWVPVSSAVYAKAAPVKHTFQVQRSFTWGAAVEESLKGSIKLIEMELKIKLDTHTTVTRSESLSYTVPRGRVMALFAAPGYVVRRFARKTWGSAMCNEVTQTCKVSSPYQHFLKVDFVR